MSKCDFTQVIVIGYGRVTGEVLAKAAELKSVYRYELKYVEHEVHAFNQALKYCQENKIEYETIPDKEELTSRFMSFINPTLIISASNNYLFPKKLLSMDNITVINFHNALLPKFPGRNAPSWAIYEDERETGITWHYVNADIDAGNIIIQKKCEIGRDTKAYELADTLMRLASEGFFESIEDVLTSKADTIQQEIIADRKIYKSKEVPGDGVFNISDSTENIYRLLRSIDYGKNDIFPQATTEIDKKRVRILRYKRIEAEKMVKKENVIFLKFDDGDYLQLKYSE